MFARSLISIVSLHICTRFCSSFKQNIKNRFKYVIGVAILWLFSTEFVVYEIWPIFWPKMAARSPDAVRVLVVGDPQLLGYENTMQGAWGSLARWDSDRFLRKTHRLSHNYFKPDVTLFLGDNFDEGEIASDGEFDDYFQRFRNVFQHVNFSQAIIMAGDNDIGGEHGYPIKEYRDRFNKYFKPNGFVQHKFVEFFKFNSMTRLRMYKRVFPRSKNVRILLSHIPMMPTMSPPTKTIIEELTPHLILSAHEHISIYMSVDPMKMELRNLHQAFAEDFDVHFVNVSDGNVHEILTPACSYRMGTQKIGYGALLIESDGTVLYSVLWLPSRLKQLISYVALTVVVFLMVCPGVVTLLLMISPRNSFTKQR